MSTILVVCTGNVCRSPLAEAILRGHPGLEGLVVRSAGTEAVAARSTCDRARAMVAISGGSLSAHSPMVLTAELIDEADLVLVSATEHRAAAALLRPAARRKTFMLKEASVFIRSLVDERAVGPQRGQRTLDDVVVTIVRQMNDMRGAGKLVGEKARLPVFPRRSSVSASELEIADGHSGHERAHRKTLNEVAATSRAIGAGLADLLRVSN